MAIAQLVDPEGAAQRVQRLIGRNNWRVGGAGGHRPWLCPAFEMRVVVHG